MGATRESSSLTDAAELRQLRRRAYGPDGDIGDDPDAIARLLELELLLGHSTVPAPPDAITAVLPTAPHVPARTAHEWISTSPRRRRRSAVIAAVALVLAAVGSILSAGSSDVTLYRRLDIPPILASQLSAVGQLGYLGIAPSDVQLYDHYRGLTVWSAPRGSGSTCLFVTSVTPPRWRVDCTPWDGRPTIDLLQYREDSRLAGFEALGDVPDGHVLRLALQDGSVVVRIVAAPNTTADDP